MSQIVHTLRFFIGMTMLAGAVALAQPFVAAVLAARGNPPTATGPGDAALERPHGLPPTMIGAAGHAIPDPRPVSGRPVADMPVPTGEEFLAAQPPQPPAPLPSSGLDLSPATPVLDGTYRSTVEIPPPPLLDHHAPPPLAAGWASHGVARPAAQAAVPQPTSSLNDYVVRDGDDLTAIALRVYGHAGAAAAIWAANRDRLADPRVLPIGLALRLPPTWTLPAVSVAQGGVSGLAIEPAFSPNWTGEHARGNAGRQPAMPQVKAGEESFWLQGAEANVPHPSATLTAAPGRGSVSQGTASSSTSTQRPATVTIGMGDSLESIAVRFYGDRAMASRIWQANRDRLRSPDLLVPGAELRLP